MTIDSHSSEADSTATSPAGNGPRAAAAPGEGSATRRRILQIALSLMSQRGVDGTSMRDLAAACDLNVASLYHYFPSKRELLEAVLVEHGFLPVHAPRPDPRQYENIGSPLAQLLADILVSMFEVEDFVRLMVGEAIRSESTARSVGLDLFTTFQSSI
jgi:AcrR family transcriptional regulator